MKLRDATPFIPESTSLRRLAEAANACQGCDLYRDATQAVFGSGSRQAALMLVGEQPGDREDLEGKPFVGPAGAVLDRALDDAAIRREETYVTNAVKHFKHTDRGKRRIHERPNRGEVEACHPWLAREVAVVRPAVLVALGAVAAQAIFGPQFRLLAMRGRIRKTPSGDPALATIHPSAVLRAEEADRNGLYAMLVADLRMAARAAAARAIPA
jgi:DNA polymerase